MQRYNNSRVDVGVTNLQCPWSLQSLPYQARYTNSRVDVGVTNLQCPCNLPYTNTKIPGWTLALQTYSVLEVCNVDEKIQKRKGGRWRYKLAVSLKLATFTIYKDTQQLIVDGGVTTIQSPWYLLSLPYKDTKTQWWTLALQTYSVQRYHAKIKKTQGRTLAQQTHGVPSWKSNIQRVHVSVTNLQCRWNLVNLHNKNTRIQGRTLALQT